MYKLENRNIAADKAATTKRITDYAEREAAPEPVLILPKGRPEDAGQPNRAAIPELNSVDLSPEKLRTAIVNNGMVIVRGLLDNSKIDPLKKIIDGVVDACHERRNNKQVGKGPYLNPPDKFHSYMPGSNQKRDLTVTRDFLLSSGAAMCVESSSAAETMLELYEELGLKDLINGYFGEQSCISAKKWVLRRSALPVDEQTWHQDGAFMGTDINSINLWISLSHCGAATGAPGMDIVPQRLYKIASSDGAVFNWSVNTDTINDSFGGTNWVSPEFQPGDAIFFDHLCLHRTQYRPDLDKVRYAIETWFFSDSAFPKNQVPMSW